MKLLSIECSAKSASCAIADNGKIIASSFVNTTLTHSETLMPMINSALNCSKTDIDDIDVFAISHGPGSFTGIRIGISALKGMAIAKNKACVGVSTLYAITNNFKDRDAVVCATMDARCNQVYAALFRIKNGKITRLCEDKAVKMEELKSDILKLRYKCPIIIAGDGANIFYPLVSSEEKVILADEHLRYQNAVGVAFAGIESFNKGEFTSPEKLLPIYLRLPQAERELKNKKEKKL